MGFFTTYRLAMTQLAICAQRRASRSPWKSHPPRPLPVGRRCRWMHLRPSSPFLRCSAQCWASRTPWTSHPRRPLPVHQPAMLPTVAMHLVKSWCLTLVCHKWAPQHHLKPRETSLLIRLLSIHDTNWNHQQQLVKLSLKTRVRGFAKNTP